MIYLGGKTKLAKHIVPVLQDIIDTKDIQTYWEPFVGGGNIIDKIRCPIRIGTDISEPLIALWNELQRGWEPPTEITEEHYNYVKTHREEYPLYYQGLVGYLSSFGIKYFQGYARYKGGSAYSERMRSLMRQLKREDIQGIKFGCCDYKNIVDVQDVLLYLDPPYKGTAKYSETVEFDYKFFYNWCYQMNQKNIVIISEYEMPEGFECIKTIQHTTNFGYRRSLKEEKLFTVKNKTP